MELIRTNLDVLSLLRPLFNDTSKTAKIICFLLVFYWAMDVTCMAQYANRNFSIPPAFDAPVTGGPRQNIAVSFGVEKLEWWATRWYK